jgi:hypothetical protein
VYQSLSLDYKTIFFRGEKPRHHRPRTRPYIRGTMHSSDGFQTDRSVGSSLPQEYHLKYALLHAAPPKYLLLNIRCAVTTHSPHSSLHFSSADFACHYTFHCSLRPSLHFSMLAALVTTVYTIRRTRHYTSQYYLHSSLHFSILSSLVTTLFNVDFARHYPLNPIFTHHYAFQCSLRQSL